MIVAAALIVCSAMCQHTEHITTNKHLKKKSAQLYLFARVVWRRAAVPLLCAAGVGA
jgi:hypothetical protein